VTTRLILPAMPDRRHQAERGSGAAGGLLAESTDAVTGNVEPGSSTTWPFNSSRGTVIFPGELPRLYSAHSNFEFDINLREPLVRDVGEYVTLSTPTLGLPIQHGEVLPRSRAITFAEDGEPETESRCLIS
jgi:hypothetical protein